MTILPAVQHGDPLSLRYFVDFSKHRGVFDIPGSTDALFLLQEQREGWWGLFAWPKRSALETGECVITTPPIATLSSEPPREPLG